MAIHPRKPLAEENLSLDARRNLYELGTLERFAIECEEYAALEDDKRAATNASNRQKTQLTNSLKGIVKREDLGPDDYVYFKDTGYKFDVAYAEKIDPADLLDLWQTDKITKEQFLECLSVVKADAERVIGSFVVAKLTVTTAGIKADIRTKKLEEKEATKEAVIVRAEPLETTTSTAVKPKPTIKLAPGKSLEKTRRIAKW